MGPEEVMGIMHVTMTHPQDFSYCLSMELQCSPHAGRIFAGAANMSMARRERSWSFRYLLVRPGRGSHSPKQSTRSCSESADQDEQWDQGRGGSSGTAGGETRLRREAPFLGAASGARLE